jgi:hypothetical protein
MVVLQQGTYKKLTQLAPTILPIPELQARRLSAFFSLAGVAITVRKA